jgi:hypothetical protein
VRAVCVCVRIHFPLCVHTYIHTYTCILQYLRVCGSLSRLGFRVLDRLEVAQLEARARLVDADGALSARGEASLVPSQPQEEGAEGIPPTDPREQEGGAAGESSRDTFLKYWNNQDSLHAFLLSPGGTGLVVLLRQFMLSEAFRAESRFGFESDLFVGVAEGKSDQDVYLTVSGTPLSAEQRVQEQKKEQRAEQKYFRQEQHAEMLGLAAPTRTPPPAKFQVTMRVMLRKIIDSVLSANSQALGE